MRIFTESLFLHESLHFLAGTLLGLLIYSMFGQFSLAVLAFLISVFIDLDHYLEGFLFNGSNLKWLFTLEPGNYWVKTGKMTILLHSWEILPLILFLGWAFQQWPLAFTITLSLFIHYIIDAGLYIHYKKMSIFHYFFLYRAYHCFNFKKFPE